MFVETIKLNSKIGIGPKLMETLHEENIDSIHDLIECFPSKYVNYTVTGLIEGYCLILGAVTTPILSLNHKGNLNSLSFSMSVNGEIIKVTIFNRSFLRSRLQIGTKIYVEGKYNAYKKALVASNIFFKLEENKITPVYSSKAPSKQINEVIMKALVRYEPYISEELPFFLLDKYHYPKYYDALCQIHNPKDMNILNNCISRMKYEEFFMFQLKLQYIRLQNKRETKIPKKWDVKKIREFIATIPFELTDDQKAATNEIFKDLKANYPANRLIQGDVGSGKTIIAAISLYAVALDNYQATLMAPTEILAKQHFDNLSKLFVNTPLKLELFTSSIKGKKRAEILERIKNGQIDIIVGTHALITENVDYHNLGLVITDEQHRFGVAQRQALKKKGKNPDVLYLTATPIPRTLAIGIFGDMDITSVKQMPNGRKNVQTKIVDENSLPFVYDFIEEELKNNNQIYAIAPLILESEKIYLHDVNEIFQEIKKRFINYNVGILHGKMKVNEKEEIMRKFKDNEIQILVSTTVVEVGVDNKNATVMLIFDAERYGLSQLHQLRGRVGRGNKKSYCFLVSKKEEVERLKVIEKTNDGFLLSEEDLRLRGPGDFFGNKQSGMPTFKIGNIVDDFPLLEKAKKDAEYIITNDMLDKYVNLRKYVEKEIDGILS